MRCLPLASGAPQGAAFSRRSFLTPQSRRHRALRLAHALILTSRGPGGQQSYAPGQVQTTQAGISLSPSGTAHAGETRLPSSVYARVPGGATAMAAKPAAGAAPTPRGPAAGRTHVSAGLAGRSWPARPAVA